MTFQKAHKDGNNGLVARRNLTEDEIRVRLSNYYSNDKVDHIINAVTCMDCWTDGNIVITSTYKNAKITFIAVANGNYMKLIEP